MFQSISTINTTPLENPEHLKHYYDHGAVYFGITGRMYLPIKQYTVFMMADIRSRLDSHERP